MARKRVKRPVCPNCGHSLSPEDNFCARCGQENHTHKLPVRLFLVELLSGLFNFDTKLLRTLRDLFWPPGLVIKEFNANKRARYVPPLRLYLFTSVLFFILLGWTTRPSDDPDATLELLPRDSTGTSGLTLRLEKGTVTDSAIVALSANKKLSNSLLDSTLIAAGETPSFLNRAMLRFAVSLSSNSLRKDEFAQRMIANFSKMLFILVPLFGLLLKLFYWGSRNYYTEHLTFALYFHTVIFITLGLDALWSKLIDDSIISAVLFVIPFIHLFGSLRTVHSQSILITLFKALALILLYGIMLLIGISVAAVVGALSI
ncbi:MAG: DUF3667 domain-containing protein [Flavobacteriales bacterium]|nr:DUF3667 domain-containing protein [Flavobacteriales bacterium]MBP7156161.1 DUF3667 domain-containing protein [Flavobacteriales bacterium]HQV75691.1 DUF3667 domain-containing protein [Flavobacteriales bacterium]HQW41392.1 DUF3667 domain-containing protein [Flavobacteriales bacterium]